MSTEAAGVAPIGDERISKWAVLVVVAAGVFMATIDSSIVNISLPTIAGYFNVALSGAVEWVIIGYLVVIAAVLLSIGRLADIIASTFSLSGLLRRNASGPSFVE